MFSEQSVEKINKYVIPGGGVNIILKAPVCCCTPSTDNYRLPPTASCVTPALAKQGVSFHLGLTFF
jgi:hypothetical protein